MPEFFKPEPGLMIWTIISFGVFLLLMWRVALGPILDMLDKRKQTIEENLKKAEEAREEAERLFAEYQKKLEEARAEAQQIVQESKKMAEKVKSDILEEARQEAEQIKQKAMKSIELERERALQELKEKAAELSVEIAGRILKRTISLKDHEELVREVIDEVVSSSEN